MFHHFETIQIKQHKKNAIICKHNMRIDVVFIYTYIIITQYVSKNKN